jgi:hypothetical protein
MRISILFILFITKSIALAQQGNAFFAATDSLSADSYKHQIGIGLSKFVNAAFPTDSNAFLLEYRYLKTPSLAYRIATDYRTESSKDSYYEFALKVGVDKKLKNYNKWQFYYGIDLWGRYLYYGNRKQHYTNVALNPFLGILFHFSKNFSVATEPGFFIKYNIRRDRKSFDPEAQAQWFESRLAKIGVIQLNFHF